MSGALCTHANLTLSTYILMQSPSRLSSPKAHQALPAAGAPFDQHSQAPSPPEVRGSSPQHPALLSSAFCNRAGKKRAKAQGCVNSLLAAEWQPEAATWGSMPAASAVSSVLSEEHAHLTTLPLTQKMCSFCKAAEKPGTQRVSTGINEQIHLLRIENLKPKSQGMKR